MSPYRGVPDLSAGVLADLDMTGLSDDPHVIKKLLEAVLAVGRGLDLDATLQRIINVAVAALDSRYGALGVRGKDGGLSAFVHTGISPHDRAAMGHLPVGRGVLGLLIDDPQVVRIDDLGAHSSSIGFPSNHPPMASFLGAPIVVRGEVFGSIYLTEKNGVVGGFTDADEVAVRVLSVAAGVAIDNARLFERARTRERWMRMLARRGAGPLVGTALTETLKSLAIDVNELTGAADTFILAVDDRRATVLAHTGALPVVEAFALEPSVPGAAPGAMDVAGADTLPAPLIRHGAQWVSVVPLMRAGGRFGVLVLTHHRRPTWDEDERAGLTTTADIASMAVAYERQQMVTRDMEMLEDRHRIARDLHDHVIQRLFAVGMSLQAMSAGTDAQIGGDRLRRVIEDLDKTVEQIRTAIFDLNTAGPGVHDSATLRRHTLDIIADLTTHASISPSVRFAGPVDTVVPAHLIGDIEAVLREGVSNAMRHARADRIDVLVSAEEVLDITIADNGVGMPPGAIHSGLHNLSRRAERCDGTFTIAAQPGGGTTITWTVPL